MPPKHQTWAGQKLWQKIVTTSTRALVRSHKHTNRRPVVQSLPPNPDSYVPKTRRGTKITSACPQCGMHRLVPISRRGIDRFLGLFVRLRRFRCNNIECGWQGNLAKSPVMRRSMKHLPQVREQQLNLFIVIGITIMVIVILLIVVALLIGWIDGSLEGYEGLFDHIGAEKQ